MPIVTNLQSMSLLWVIVAFWLLLATIFLADAFPISNRQHRERNQCANSCTTLLSKNHLAFTTNLLASQFSAEEFKDGLDGTENQEMFLPKLMDGIAFNVFGIGRKEDEEANNGTFQPPMNSMTDIVVVITGASGGLGLESAKRLALAGATVIATARTHSKTCDAVQAIQSYCRGGPKHGKGAYINNNPVVHGITLDLADLSSVRTFPDRYRELMTSENDTNSNTKKINVLMNNACGGNVAKRELTVDGYETTFQSGYLGHFVLTARLFEEGLLNDTNQISKTEENTQHTFGCTVINVSSSAHRSAKVFTGDKQIYQNQPTYGFDFDNIQSDREFSMFTYSRTKLANVMFTKELQRLTDASSSSTKPKSSLIAVSVDPGVVATNIWSKSEPSDADWKDMLLSRVLTKFMTKVDRGANAQVWLAFASSPKSKIRLIGGQHYGETRQPIPSSKFAIRQDSNRKLWEISEELGDIRFDMNV